MEKIKNYVVSIATEQQKEQLKKSKRVIKSDDIMKSIVKDFINLPQYSRVKEKLKDVPLQNKFEKILQCDTDDIRQFIWFMLNEMSKYCKSMSEMEVIIQIIWEHQIRESNSFKCPANSFGLN